MSAEREASMRSAAAAPSGGAGPRDRKDLEERFDRWRVARAEGPAPMDPGLAEGLMWLWPGLTSRMAGDLASLGPKECSLALGEWARAAKGLPEWSPKQRAARTGRQSSEGRLFVGAIAARWGGLVAATEGSGPDLERAAEAAEWGKWGPAAMSSACELEDALGWDARLGMAMADGLAKALGSALVGGRLEHGAVHAFLRAGADPSGIIGCGMRGGDFRGRSLMGAALSRRSWRLAGALAKAGAAVDGSDAKHLAGTLHQALGQESSRGLGRSDCSRRAQAISSLLAAAGVGWGGFRTKRGRTFESMAMDSLLVSRSASLAKALGSAGMAWSDGSVARLALDPVGSWTRGSLDQRHGQGAIDFIDEIAKGRRLPESDQWARAACELSSRGGRAFLALWARGFCRWAKASAWGPEAIEAIVDALDGGYEDQPPHLDELRALAEARFLDREAHVVRAVRARSRGL